MSEITKVPEAVFSQEQVDSMIAAQRRESETKAAIELEAERVNSENIRSQGAARIAELTGSAAGDANDVLARRMADDTRNAARLASLDRIFRSSVESTKLAKSSGMVIYRQLRQEWETLNGHSKVKVAATPGKTAFRRD